MWHLTTINFYQKTQHPWQPDKNLIIILSLQWMQLCQKLLNVKHLEFSISLLERAHWNFSWGLNSIYKISCLAGHTRSLYTFVPFTGPRIFCLLSSLNSSAALKNRGRSAKWNNGKKAGLWEKIAVKSSDTVKILRSSRHFPSSATHISSCIKVD